MRTNRPLAETVTVWVPSAPLVTGVASVQALPSADTWILKVAARAVSQCIEICVMAWVEPRSTCSHCGSANADDHRVPSSPSVAELAGVPAFSVDDAVVGLPCESRVSAACALGATSTIETSRRAPASVAHRRGMDMSAPFGGRSGERSGKRSLKTVQPFSKLVNEFGVVPEPENGCWEKALHFSER